MHPATSAEHDPHSRPPGSEHVAPVSPESAEINSAKAAVDKARQTLGAIQEHVEESGGDFDAELANFTEHSGSSEDPNNVEAGALPAFDAVLSDVHEGHDPTVDLRQTLHALGTKTDPEVVARCAHTESLAGAADDEVEEALKSIPHEFAERPDHQVDSMIPVDLKKHVEK